MKTCSSLLSLFIVAFVITLGCGSPLSKVKTSCGSYAGSNMNGSLQSVSVCPAIADAQQYPDGKVSFDAIGVYTTQPSPALIPSGVIWGVCQNQQTTNEVTVTNGVAQCASGATGTYTVWATGNPVCNVIGPCGACGPTGKAQLTCP